jgi:DNA-binding transcriptional regulator PaaX
VLSNARTDKLTVALEAVENKIRQNSQRWEDEWIMVIMVRGDPPAKFKQIDQTGLREAGYGPEDF